MGKLRQINDRNQITIPANLLKSVGLKPGDLLELEARGTNLILKPRKLEEPLESEDWKALDQLVSRQVRDKEYTEYPSPRKARSHLKKRIKNPG